jgi:hypothetical protein
MTTPYIAGEVTLLSVMTIVTGDVPPNWHAFGLSEGEGEAMPFRESGHNEIVYSYSLLQ